MPENQAEIQAETQAGIHCDPQLETKSDLPAQVASVASPDFAFKVPAVAQNSATAFAGLPPKRSADSTNDRVQQANQIRLDDRSILLADDSPDNQRLFQRILLSAGAKVDLADNGAMAVKMQSEKNYDVIVMDIRMPILDGYQATRKIRTAGFDGPIIALTAHATPGEEGRCRDSGCSHFHLKPIDRLSLLSAVSAALENTAI